MLRLTLTVRSRSVLALLALAPACGGKFEDGNACAALDACGPIPVVSGEVSGAGGKPSASGGLGVPGGGVGAAGGVGGAGGKASRPGGHAGTGGKGGELLVGGEGGVGGSLDFGAGAGGEAGASEGGAGCSEGASECCPEEYPVWCDHDFGETIGHCFKANTDCSTVTVCAPEPFARSCPAGDHVVCWETPCGSDWYGGCAISEYFPGCDWDP